MAKFLAVLHYVYGVVAGLLSGWMLVVLFTDPESAGGCCGSSFAPVFQVLFSIVFVLAVAQLLVARSYLRGRPRGARAMQILSKLNLAINLACVSVVLGNHGGLFALWWAPFLAVNLVSLQTFGRAARAV